MDITEVSGLIEKLADYKKFNKLEFYVPYDFQKEFHFAQGFGDFIEAPSDSGKHLALIRALMCANQIGKTTCGAMEVAYHLTGLYPVAGKHFYPEYWAGTDPPVKCEYAGQDIWPNGWEGHVFSGPLKILVGSNTNETARDICQLELFGEPTDMDTMLGTGSVPKKCITKTNRKPGVVNAFDSVLVKHVKGGNSECYFRAYEQGKKKFMGVKYKFVWPDEEPPSDIQSQIRRSQLSTNGVEAITFTPEDGITEVVHGFIHEIRNGQALIRASWDDAPHMTSERREQKLLDFPEHERDMRSKGEPLVGSGLIFPILEETIKIDPIEIPSHWARINGIDFGWDHPFACAFAAWDRDTDTIYIYDGYREKRALPAIHADAIKQRGAWIPISWPKDGYQHEKGTGKELHESYRSKGLNMFREHFTNPPRLGEEEGKGGVSVEAGIMEMLEMMETGRFKVFSTVTAFWEEKGMYHRKGGKIIPLFDDFMSATRYAVMFRRHATTKIVIQPKQNIRKGLRNW